MKELLKRWLPRSLQDGLRRARLKINRIRHRGTGCFCPVCESHIDAFVDLDAVWGGFRHQTRGELCPVCHCSARHRLIWLFLKERTDLFDGRPKKILHAAPEYFLSMRIRVTPGIEYVSLDLHSPYAMTRMDLTDLAIPAASFDAVLSVGVLEHIPDDRKALAEISRVLKPAGWALLWVPVADRATTLEDPAVTDPAERHRLFGQADHVRRYGKDYRDRLAEAGFDVTVAPYTEELGTESFERFGLRRKDDIYFARKR